MKPGRDVTEAIRCLEDVADKARRLARELPDLHAMAYSDRPEGDRPRGPSEPREAGEQETPFGTVYYLDEEGWSLAKKVLKRVVRGSVHLAKEIGALETATFALQRGASADHTLRGTTITLEEYRGALGARRRREAQADGVLGGYSPIRHTPQPPLPRGSR